MKKLLWLSIPVLLIALGWLAYRQRQAPPEVVFTRVTRGTLVSALVTNGKVEPLEWSDVVAERGGVVSVIRIERGGHVARGSVLAEIAPDEAKSELASAETRLEQVRADVQALERGGRRSAVAEIDAEVANARLDLEVARKERASLERLVEKQAATRQELIEATRRVERAELQIAELGKRRAALVDSTDRVAAQARLREAEIAVERARLEMDKLVIRSPLAGSVYETGIRTGAFLSPGQIIAKVGRVDKVRVKVYVDEPELGRVAAGMPVTITWDALEGKQWRGVVERMPAEITAFGSRQVGEVACVIDNPGGDLLPGTNVNAEIRSRVAEGALSIPREALRRNGDDTGVLRLESNRAVWRKVTTDISSITRTQIVEGLNDGDAVALPTETPLADGMVVRAVVR